MRSGSLAAVAAAVLALAGCASQAATPSAGAGTSSQSAISTVTGSTSAGAPSASASSSAPHSHTSSPSAKASSSASAPSGGGMDPFTACVQAGADPKPVPGSTLPRTTDNDVQCLVDPLEATKAGEPALARFSRMADPSTASRGLRSWILSPYTPDLVSFDQTAYGIHGDTGPYMLVAIATPKRVDGVSAKYPDFVDGILSGFSDLYSPPAVGEHAAGYGLVITCGHETTHGRTVCAWTGATPGGGHQPFLGVLVILSVVPPAQAETVAENVLLSITG